ncbi:leucine-rich repeat neuronal protein 2-like [Macrosteles quadrilineatus]|uniref:leucine-rich repeat neuronal protein 2-like n=1 Tax=Macrosteles quadrilineatus TaxID=74068 RepID=UPI0023E25D7D|nr:leucine-rich repeat neuronal protein 2-like [Macrosteles quadrilineatus]
MRDLVVLCVALVVYEAAADLCQKCVCSKDELNCDYAGLEDHFDDSEWNGTDQTIVSFGHNYIIHLKPFPQLPVTNLSLSHNWIARIEPACFKQLANLTQLDLSHNRLTSDQLRPDVFKGHYAPEAYEPLRNLKTLNLASNALHSLHSDLFEHLPNLEDLSLASNPLKVLDRQTTIAITSIPYLKILDLSSTSLRTFCEHVLHTPRFLEVLDLSRNLFKTVPQTLEDSHSLKKLFLDENPISEIMSFPPLPYLEVLSISWMPNLTRIGPGSLSGLVSLQELYCSHNPLLNNISGAALSQPAVGSQTWPPLKKIALNNNKLGYLDFELVGHWEQQEMVNIQNNPWVCECHNQWLVSTLLPLLERLNGSEHNVAGVVCHAPDAMMGQSLAQLDHRAYHMRCLDLYDHHPERDGSFLVGTLIGVIFAVPLTILVYVTYSRHLRTTAARYHRAFYKPQGAMHEFSINPASEL